MPPVVTVVATYALQALYAIGVSTAVAIPVAGFIGSAIVYGGASAILSGALSSKPKRATNTGNVNSPESLRIEVSPSRKWCYGKTAIGGEITYWEVLGANNEYLWLVVALHDTPMQSIESFICDNTTITFSANAATNKYVKSGNPRMWRWDKLGAESQTVETNLDTASTAWGTNHRLRGVAYYVLKMQHEADVYPQGIPSPIVVVKGRKIWDPRLDNNYGGSGTHDIDDESTWAWSANSALCLLDYLIGPKLNGKRIGGVGVPIAQIDYASFAAAATICDENVSLAAGGTEDRYTCHGLVEALEDKESVVEAILRSMHGTLVMRGGKLHLIAGAAQTSIMSLDDDDLDGPITVNTSISRQEIANKITCVFADPSQNYMAVPGPPLTVAQYVTDDGSVTLEREVAHRFTTSSTTVNRLNKLILADFREQLTIEAQFKPKAIEISAGDTFTWGSSKAGYASQKMICLSRQVLPSGAVQIVARQETDAKYSWATSEEQSPPSFTTSSGSSIPDAPAAPTGLAFEQHGNAVTVTWNQSTEPYLSGYDVLFGPQGDVIGNATSYEVDRRATSYTTTEVAAGAYTLFVRGRDIYGQTGSAVSMNADIVATIGGAELKSLNDIIDELSLSTNLVFCFDIGNSTCYPGSGTTLEDLSSSNNDFTMATPDFLGTAGSLGADTYLEFLSTDKIYVSGGSNPAAIRDAHKSGSDWSFLCVFYNPPWINGVSTDKIIYLLDTGNQAAYGGTWHGIRVAVNVTNSDPSFPALELDIFLENSSVITAQHTVRITENDISPAGGWHFIACRVDSPGGSIISCINGSLASGPALGWASYSSTNASNLVSFDHAGDNDGTRFAMSAFWSDAKSADELVALYTLIKAHRPGFAIP